MIYRFEIPMPPAPLWSNVSPTASRGAAYGRNRAIQDYRSDCLVSVDGLCPGRPKHPGGVFTFRFVWPSRRNFRDVQNCIAAMKYAVDVLQPAVHGSRRRGVPAIQGEGLISSDSGDFQFLVVRDWSKGTRPHVLVEFSPVPMVLV